MAGCFRSGPSLCRLFGLWRVAGLCSILICWLLLASAAQAQGGVKISGETVDEAGAPLVGVTVVLTPVDANWQPSGGMVARVSSNKKGRFAFGFAKAGDYVLSAELEGKQIASATVQMRDHERKPVYGPDGVIEDKTAAVDPANPVVALSVPRDASTVQVTLTFGEAGAAAAGGGAPAMGSQIVGSGLGDEVEAVLARIEARQYQAALDEIDALIAGNPELAPLYYLKGFTLVRKEQLAEAEQALRTCLALDPAIIGASGLLGQILGQQGQYAEAAEFMRRELDNTADPLARAPLLLGLGQALLETGDVPGAVAALEEARAIDPQNPDTRVQLIDAYIRSGNEEGAEKLLAEETDPRAGAILHFNLAAKMLRAEQWEKGAEHLRQALALDPGLAEAHNYLAQAYLALGRRADAIAEYEAYVAAAPEAHDAEQTRRIINALRQSLEDGAE